MIFKKGAGVEVLEKGKEPFESWRPARILSGNGHTYMVKYDSCSVKKAMPINKVPRKALRPHPPLEIKSWNRAELVEVFDDGSWKLAKVLRTDGLNMIVARLLGSPEEIVVPFFQLRVPQTWKDNHWIPLKKDSVNCKGVHVKRRSKRHNLSNQIPLLAIKVKKYVRMDQCPEEYDDYADKFYQKSFGRTKKWSQECIPPVYPHAGPFGKEQQFKKKNLFEVVDAVDSPQKYDGEKQMNAAFSHETSGFGEIGIYCQKPIANGGSKFVASLSLSENESTSSVGSCSVIDGLWRPIHHNSSQGHERCGLIDDAKSFCGSPTEPYFIREDDMPNAIHYLELDAYCSTLRSLYASGCLSWDQESLLTNLRVALNISNDEHLSELKDLMSSRS